MLKLIVLSLLGRDVLGNRRKIQDVEAAIAALSNEYNGAIDLEAVGKAKIEANDAGLRFLRERMRKAAMEDGTFYVAVTGHSVCAGHGNYYNESYGVVLDRMIKTGFHSAGIAAKSFNFGMGGSASLPMAWCLPELSGTAPDIVTWDFEMVEGKQWRLSEVFARSAWTLQALPFFFTDAVAPTKSPRRSALEWYGNQGMPYAMAPTVEQLSTHLFSRRRFPGARRGQRSSFAVLKPNASSPLLRDIVFSPQNEHEKKRKFNTPNGAPGRVKWHPGWRAHRLMAAVVATWLLSILRDALKEQQNLEYDFSAFPSLPPPETPHCGDTSLMCESPLAGTCATTYEPKFRGDLLPLLSHPPWSRVLAAGDPALRAQKLKLGYLDKKWTLEGHASDPPLVIDLPPTPPKSRNRPSMLLLCEATTGWRRPGKLASLDSGCTVLLNGNRLFLTKIKAVQNCFRANGRFKASFSSHRKQTTTASASSSDTAELIINVTAPTGSFVYLSHIIWSSLPPRRAS